MNSPILNPSFAAVFRLAGMVLSLVWVIGFPNALAHEGGRFANFDKRTGAAAAAARREDAAASIRARVPRVRVERDRITGTPAFIGSPHEFLSGPAGTGKAVPAAAIAALPAGDPHRGIKAFVNEHRLLFGHTGAALDAASLKTDYRTAHSGIRTVIWQQRLDGIPVFEAQFAAHLTAAGELINVGSHFVPDIAAAAGRVANRAALRTAPPISSAQAIAFAAATLEEPVRAAEVRPVDPAPSGATQKQRFKAPRLNEATAQLVWLPMDATTLRLCWDVILVRRKHGCMDRVLVDAQTGAAVLRRCLTADISEATYRVYTGDSPTPFSPGHATPSPVQPPPVARSLVTLPALNATASPNGWIDDGVNETRGNNVDAHLDLDADDLADLPRPQGSPFRVFDLPLDLAQPPGSYRDAAVTQLFYTCNWVHDRLYDLGFTEPAGNFQLDNFGRGGTGNDAVQADAQDGSGTNNANFSTPPDGFPGRMQMYLFTGPNPDLDGDLDTEIVIHEYVHGLSNRLVGGGVGISELQSAGLGEGWSDFFALALLSGPGDQVHGCYAAGAYATRNFLGLAQNYYFGIRRYPYSTDMVKNPLTFKDIDPSQASPHSDIPRNPVLATTADEVHNMGEVWCATLWDARANLITKHGFATGNPLILQLVTDGMKLAPANPNFVQARDAIVQAELALTGGANANELWAAFAKRGLGADAIAPPSNTTEGVVESFDLPDALSVSPNLNAASSGPVGGPFTPLSTTFTLTNTGAAAIDWLAGADTPWLTLSQAGGALADGAQTTVTVALNSAAQILPAGIYPGTVTFHNVTTGLTQTRIFKLKIGQPNLFTELFEASANDTANQSFTFTPDGSANFYAPTREVVTAFPTDPAGGTILALTDDSNAQVSLTGGASVSLYGTGFTSFFVGSNGYVTFGAGDIGYSESFPNHFAMRRIAALYDDLNPGVAGTVSWQQLADRVAVTFQNVPEYGATSSNSFQIELFFDGRISLTLLGIAATDGLIGLSKGTGLPDGFTASDFSAFPSNDRLGVTLPASATEGDAPVSGTVTATPAPASDLVVTLTSNTPARATVPATVTIPAGQTSASFAIAIVEDALLNATAPVLVSASATAYTAATQIIPIHDNETATLSVSIPASATEGDGSVEGTVTVSVAPDTVIAVALSSSDPSAALPPGLVLIPAGETTASFTLAIIDDSIINGTHAATITAHVENWTSGSAAIDVHDNEGLDLAVSLPPRVLEGSPGTGTVSVFGTLLADLTVTLESDNPSQVSVPATTTILAGQSSASFPVTAVDDAMADGTQNATILATATGFTAGSAAVEAIDNELDHFTVSAIGTSQVKGVPFPVSITARNAEDLAITNYAGSASLSAAGAGGAVSVSPSTVSGFAGGIWTGSVTANTFGTDVVLTADSAGRTGTSNPFTVTFGAVHHFGWSPPGSAQIVGVPFPATIAAQDAANNTVSSFAGAAALSCGPTGRSIGTGTVPWGQPMYTYYQDSRTQSIYLAGELGGTGTISALSLNVTALPGQTMNHWTIRMKHTPLSSYTVPAWDATGWTTVYQSNQTIPATGWVKFVFTTPFQYDGTSNLLIDFSHNNSSYSIEGQCRSTATAATRSIYYFTESAFGDPLTWSGTKDPSPLTSNLVPNVQLTVARDVTMTPLTTGNFVNGLWTGNVTVQQAATNVTLLADNGAGITGESGNFNVTPVAILAVEPPGDFTPSGVAGGPLAPPSKSYTITNTGQSPLHWTAGSAATWVTLSPASGTLAAGASTAVTATIHPDARALDPGTYHATLLFTNTTTGVGNTARAAALTLRMPVPELHAPPPITGGTTSTVSWNFLPGADLYEVQYDSTPAFANPVSSSLIGGTSHPFTGLGDGTLHYRVRARRLLGMEPAGWTQTGEGDFATGLASGVSLTTSPGDVTLASAPKTWTENFDEPGSDWSDTIFSDGSFIRGPLGPGATIPNTTPPLPINEGGDQEAQGDNTSALMPGLPAHIFADGSIEASIVPASAPASAHSGLLLRAVRSGTQVSGYGAIITNAASTSSLTIYRFTQGVTSQLGAPVPFPKIAANENLRLRFAASGTTLTASLWKTAIETDAIVETPVPLENSTNSCVRTDAAYASGVAGLFSQVTAPANGSLYDDVTVTAANVYVPSGSITTGLVSPSPLARWGTLTFTADVSAAGTALTVDVLDASGALLAADVASGTPLSLLAAIAAQPSIRLRANLSTSAALNTPMLRDWTVGSFANSVTALDSDWSPPVSSTQDGTPPVITVIPADYTATEQLSVTLQGSASDTSGIPSLTVNGMGAITGDAFAQWSTGAVALPVGLSAFTITAQDGAVPPNVTTVLRRILRYTPTSARYADGLTDKWKIDHGLDPFDNSGANGPDGDPDKDGIVNLLERAQNLDPWVPDHTGLPSVTPEINGADGLPYLTFTYRRLLDPAGLTYGIETSPDLQAWAPAASGDFDEISATPTGDGLTESVILRVKPALTAPGMNARFVRLRVTAQ